MPNVSIIMKGERDFAEVFAELGEAGEQAMRRFHIEGPHIVVRHTRPLVPVKTGDLRDSLRAAGAERGGVAIVGDNRAYYARFVHNGTARIRRQPFMHQGAGRSAPEVHDLGYRLLSEAIDG